MRRKYITKLLNKIQTAEVEELYRRVSDNKAKHSSISSLNILRAKEKKQLKEQIIADKAQLQQLVKDLQK